MAFFWGDGFDLYAAAADAALGYWDTMPNAFTFVTGRFSGSRAITTPAAGGVFLTKSSGANDALHHINVAFQQPGGAISGTTALLYFQFSDGATNQCCVVFRSDGAILLTSATPGGTTLATYTGAYTAINTWYEFEVEVFISPTAGYMNVRKNGNASNDFTSATNLNTRPGTNSYANKLTVGLNSASQAQTIDDLLWRSDASAVPWVGDIRCFTRMPASDASVQWSRSGSVVPLTPYIQASTTAIATATARYSSFTAPCNGTLGTTVISLATGYTGNMKCTLFASSGTAPTTIIASATNISNPATGNNTFTFASPPTLTQGAQYWLGFSSDVTSGSWNTNAGSTAGASSSTSYASFPAASPSITAQNAIIVTMNITPTTAPNGAFVADIQQDAANTYVFSSTVGQSDLYGVAAIGSTPSSIVGVTTRALAQKSDAGTRNIAVQLQSGGSNVQSASTALAAGTWGWVSRNDLVDPATGAAWTATGVNNATIGQIVTA